MIKATLSLFAVAAACVLMALAPSAMAQNPTRDAYSGVAGQLQGGGGSPDAVAGSDSLPFTGFEVTLAAVLGLTLLGTGLVLRRGLRSPT